MDLKITETGNGGDLATKPKDLFIIYGLQNMPFLGMFGGNFQSSTPTKRVPNEQAFDWWGNSLLFPNDSALQFNSLTERILNNTPLNSSGRLQIENAVKKDLNFMKPFAEINVSVSIIATDKIEIFVAVKQLDNLQEREFIYVWDATRKELSTSIDEDNVSATMTAGFDYFLDFDIE